MRTKNINGTQVPMTLEEEAEFVASIEQPNVLEQHKAAVEAAVDKMAEAVLKEYNYTNFEGQASIGDVAAGVVNEAAEWHQEAIQVNEWYASVYAALYAYQASVTLETMQPIEQFLNSLPNLIA